MAKGKPKCEVIREKADYDLAIEKFCCAIMEGSRRSDAYRIAHPRWKSTNENATRVKAYEFEHQPRVQDRLREMREEMQSAHAEFRDRLIDMLQEEISTCYHDNRTLSPVMKQVDTVTRILGMDKQTVKVEGELKAADQDEINDKLNFLIAQQGKGRRK